MADTAKHREELLALFAKCNQRLGFLYSAYLKQLLELGYSEDILEQDALFNFDNFPQLKVRLNDIFLEYYKKSLSLNTTGINEGFALSFTHSSEIMGQYSVLSQKATEAIRIAAAKTFINSRLHSEKGLNLSNVVWTYCQQTKTEFEMAMSNILADGLKKGTSAETIGRALRIYLNNPDMMYRRYHTIKILKDGIKKDIVKWRKRKYINGKVRFIEEPLENVGRGVYRSSRMNALRVARTEINAAYLTGHNERWRNEPFIIGQFVHVSPQHTHDDICDELQGNYPKDYIFTGWHPLCLCTSDPIMIEGEEKKEFYKRLASGEDMSNYISPRTITDVPEVYKQYIEINKDKIVEQAQSMKLPWHLDKNKKYWIGQLSQEQRSLLGFVSSRERKERIAAIAKKRHDARTDKQKDKIQNKWNIRRSNIYNKRIESFAGVHFASEIKDDLFERYIQIRYAIKKQESVEKVENLFNRFKHGYKIKQNAVSRKVALNVIGVAKKYGETDIHFVQNALIQGNYTLAREEAKNLAKRIISIKKDEEYLSTLIPNINQYHKQFTSKQLHEVYDAVEKKMQYLSSLPLEKQKTKLYFEFYYYLGKNITGVQQKYATWEVSQSAYIKQFYIVSDKIDWLAINNSISELKAFLSQTQNIKYKELINNIEAAILDKDKNLAKALIDDAKNKKQSLLNLKVKKTADKLSKNGTSSATIFDADAYTQARKDAAIWAKNTKEADNVLRDICSEVWRKATKEEKDAIYGYTVSFSNINEPLRGLTYYGSSNKKQLGLKRIPLMEKIINKSSYNKDIWLQRGGGMVELKKFGLANYNTATDAEIKALVGKTGTDGAFVSAGVAKGKGFPGKVITNIYAPKGTKMMYAEPFSFYGKGMGYSWDGVAKQTFFGDESEIILQRGTTFRITKVEKSGGVWYIDVEVIGQDVLPFPYKGGYPYK